MQTILKKNIESCLKIKAIEQKQKQNLFILLLFITMTIKEKKDYIQYHVDFLNEKYGFNFWFNRKTCEIYVRLSNYNTRKIYLWWLNWIMDYIDWIYAWIKQIEEQKQ